MHTATRRRCLRALGITEWVRRKPGARAPLSPPESVTPAPQFRTVNTPRSACATVIAEWSDDALRLAPEHPAGRLLMGILEAVQPGGERFLVLQVTAGNAALGSEGWPLSGSLVVCLAEQWQPPTGVHAGRQWLALPSLRQMLSDRRFKREAWKQLEPWAGKLK